MSDALKNQSREILLSICVWGYADVYSWGNSTGVNWRSTGDIFPGWDNIVRIININSFRMHATNFWGRNDADMLEIGNGLSDEESRSHFAFWAAMKSPLLIGTDVSKLDDHDLDILKNKYLLDFNQDDEFGAPAMPYKWGENADWTFNGSWPAQYWSGESKAGTLVLVFNPGEELTFMGVNLNEIQGTNSHTRKAIDVWTGDELSGCYPGWRRQVGPHDTAILLFTNEECEQSTPKYRPRRGYLRHE